MKDTQNPNNIILVGMPGCFKSTVGKILAGRLSLAFLDTDALYEKKYGVSIAETFKTKGESVFRECEASIVAEACRQKGAVIATGGGVVLRGENIAALKSGGVVMELCADAHTIFSRVKSDASRPLLADMRIETVEKLYAERAELYKSAADFRVNTANKSPEKIAEEIAKILAK